VPRERAAGGRQHRRAPDLRLGRAELIEAYLIDFDGDLYGDELRLRFLERLRGERRFATVEALVEEMHPTSSRPARSARAPRALG
jgi:riboflavin kinase/FMN adenylyltransferase